MVDRSGKKQRIKEIHLWPLHFLTHLEIQVCHGKENACGICDLTQTNPWLIIKVHILQWQLIVVLVI